VLRDSSRRRRRALTPAARSVTEEQLEAYRMASTKYEDPMANYKDEEA
jgi:hypothetical protein